MTEIKALKLGLAYRVLMQDPPHGAVSFYNSKTIHGFHNGLGTGEIEQL